VKLIPFYRYAQWHLPLTCFTAFVSRLQRPLVKHSDSLSSEFPCNEFFLFRFFIFFFLFLAPAAYVLSLRRIPVFSYPSKCHILYFSEPRPRGDFRPPSPMEGAIEDPRHGQYLYSWCALVHFLNIFFSYFFSTFLFLLDLWISSPVPTPATVLFYYSSVQDLGNERSHLFFLLFMAVFPLSRRRFVLEFSFFLPAGIINPSCVLRWLSGCPFFLIRVFPRLISALIGPSLGLLIHLRFFSDGKSFLPKASFFFEAQSQSNPLFRLFLPFSPECPWFFDSFMSQ